MGKVARKIEIDEADFRQSLDDILRTGAQEMLIRALEHEVSMYLSSTQDCRDLIGRALVCRNGHGQTRTLTSGGGSLKIRAPRINDKRLDESGNRIRFESRILPAYARRSPKLAEALPVLYLRGLSSNAIGDALKDLLGETTSGLSSSAISKLTDAWLEDFKQFKKRDLSQASYVYVWADGIYFGVRDEDEKMCTLVVMGVTLEGNKEIIAVEDGYRESAEAWKSILRDLTTRGMHAPKLAIADGALGFWSAVSAIWPTTRQQRCWVHKKKNILGYFPKKGSHKVTDAIDEIIKSATKADAQKAVTAFKIKYQNKYPKAVECLLKDKDSLLAFFDFPDVHWTHIRTTNPLESAFATVRLRTNQTRACGSKTKTLTMVLKLLQNAQKNWNKVRGHQMLECVWNGIKFADGIKVEAINKSQTKYAA